MNDWVSVGDRLPEKTGIYPTCSMNPSRPYITDWIDSLCEFNAEAKPGQSKWQHSSGFYDNGVTHWMPLPEPPHTAPQA